jgi:hypothetical protein
MVFGAQLGDGVGELGAQPLADGGGGAGAFGVRSR